MRYLLLFLLGTALAAFSLQADSLTVSAGLFGSDYPPCETTGTDCLAGDPTHQGPYAEVQYSRTVSGNKISYTTYMDFETAGGGDIIGTINLPSDWTSVDISGFFGGGNVSPNFVVTPSFGDHLRIPTNSPTPSHYTLDPSIPNFLNVVEDAQGGYSSYCYPGGCVTNTYGDLQYVLTLIGDAPVVDPVPTPEPTSFSYTAVPLLGFFLARHRSRRA